MAESEIMTAVKFLKKCLIDNGLSISKLILFGSQSKGKVTEESDVDVIIISSDFKNKNIFQRAELTKKAEIMTIKKFLIPFDIITMTPEEFKFGKNITAAYAKEEGQVIYG